MIKLLILEFVLLISLFHISITPEILEGAYVLPIIKGYITK